MQNMKNGVCYPALHCVVCWERKSVTSLLIKTLQNFCHQEDFHGPAIIGPLTFFAIKLDNTGRLQAN